MLLNETLIYYHWQKHVERKNKIYAEKVLPWANANEGT